MHKDFVPDSYLYESGTDHPNMYWIYLITFTFTVFVPSLIKEGYWFFNVTAAQEMMIFLLGMVTFVIFLIMEKALNRVLDEKKVLQRQLSRSNKDLTNSYSYIGETNRKLDILENIALGYPESPSLAAKNPEEAYDSIMGAVQVFGKSDEFVLRFVKKPEMEIMQEIKSFPEIDIEFPVSNFEEDKNYHENDNFIFICSPKSIENIYCCFIIRKKQSSHGIEDREMMKTLASQALFIFSFMRQKKQIKCVI